MFGDQRRVSTRSLLISEVKLFFSEGGEVYTHTVDISNVGMGVSAHGWEVPPIGAKVFIQVQDLPKRAPFESMTITRHEQGVVGLAYVGSFEVVSEVDTNAPLAYLDGFNKLT